MWSKLFEHLIKKKYSPSFYLLLLIANGTFCCSIYVYIKLHYYYLWLVKFFILNISLYISNSCNRNLSTYVCMDLIRYLYMNILALSFNILTFCLYLFTLFCKMWFFFVIFINIFFLLLYLHKFQSIPRMFTKGDS